MSADSAMRIFEVRAAMALASTIESGHGVNGSWLPGAA